MARKWKVRKWRWAEDGHPTTTSSAQHKNTVKSEREREREIQSDREREREKERKRERESGNRPNRSQVTSANGLSS